MRVLFFLNSGARAGVALGILLAAGGVARALGASAPAQPAAAAVAPVEELSAVRVNVTDQPWDFFHPWSKQSPFSHRALGTVLEGGRVLVTAELIANSNYVELERPESGEKTPATVEAVDYEANLALLKPSAPEFLKGIKPLTITDAAVGDHVAVWQLESTGALLSTEALVTTVEVGKYPVEDINLLTYQLTSSLQYREGSFTVPVVKKGKLVGLLLRYDPRTQNVDVIPAPVIQHFLHDAAAPHYAGFPRAGLLFSPARDPQLRRYAQLPLTKTGGVFITQVQAGSPAAEAGIQVGDVLLALDNKAVDEDGNYEDARYGKLSLINWISLHEANDKVPLEVFRGGKTLQLQVTLRHRPAEEYVIPPYVIGQAPKYYVLGGLVLQELSRQYLKEWGDWQKKAPEKFVYLDRYQSQLFHGEIKHVVILSQVLPSNDAIGYEELSGLVVKKINGMTLKSFDDVAAALQHPENGFHKIEFDENPNVIYLDAAQVAADAPELMKNYGLPAISRTD